MTTNVNKKWLWWTNKETIDFKLKSMGTIETYRNAPYRLLGTKEWIHIDREPKFDGKKRTRCQGLPMCKFCVEGHKATMEITNVPIEVVGVDAGEYLTNLRKSQHDTITAEVDRLEMLKLNPYDYIFSLTRTGERYPDNWKITLSEVKKEKKDWSKEPTPTKKEKDAIAQIIEEENKLIEGGTPSTNKEIIKVFTFLLGCPIERAEYLTDVLKEEKKNK